MAKQDPRRELKFESLDDVVAEAQRLLENGYQARGNWSLGQTCFHLKEWARFPMDGFPTPPWFMRAIFGSMKWLGLIARMKQSILESGFKPGTPTAPDTVPTRDAVANAEGVQQLAEVIERMKSFSGNLHASPLFGDMDRETHIRVTLLHAEHHLGFLWPVTDAVEVG